MAIAFRPFLVVSATLPLVLLAGCPLGGPATGASPTPAPTATPTATATPTPAPTATPSTTRTSGIVFAEVKLKTDGLHVVSLKNLGSAAVDVNEWVVGYQAPGLDVTYLRVSSGSLSVPAGAAISLYANATGSASLATEWYPFKQANLGGSGNTKFGIQSAGGALAIFKGADDDDELQKAANLVDYVQWGAAPTTAYFGQTLAVTAKLWATGTYAPVGVAGKELDTVTVGATGSANWILSDD